MESGNLRTLSGNKSNFRIIANLDIKGEYLIKTIQLEGLRKIGNPNKFAIKYYNENIDEIICQDRVASLYGRNNLYEIISETSKNVFVPITAGGGVRTVNDVYCLLKAGADKVIVNSGVIKNINFLKEIINEFGSQCIVVSIEAKKISHKKWEAFTECGRQKTSVDVIDWVKKSSDLGAGEILVTSIDNEGKKCGFDIDLINIACQNSFSPVIAAGGMWSTNHLFQLLKYTRPNAVAIAGALHYENLSIKEIKNLLKKENFIVR